ncbi:hypothetical protein [Bradyrhizobium prioriisuperbiae]|uniref:hypothetical protein n=1 Tax=Bradyrhizobium prioriisuperbiae TaxID=2854389 RepID=UPI0028EEDABA|nr:hypothetical protein [Bradyrhizobium prioritasuperba]
MSRLTGDKYGTRTRAGYEWKRQKLETVEADSEDSSKAGRHLAALFQRVCLIDGPAG